MSSSAAVPSPRIALYSHDTLGLGHLRRNLLIAQALASAPLNADVLLITGACEATRFALPPGVDCLTLPAIQKTNCGTYRPRRLRVPYADVVSLRSHLIRQALTQFAPHVFVVDNVPQGPGGELLRALTALEQDGHTRCVLGLRDICDAPEAVRSEWKIADNEPIIRRFYEELWIYGDPHVYNRVEADGLAPDLADRAVFLGYLDQSSRSSPAGALESAQLESVLPHSCPLMLCLTGGGQDGAELAGAFAAARIPEGHRGVVLTGPHFDADRRASLERVAASRDDLVVLEFVSDVADLLKRASRVICMGGYNTLGEVLAFEKPALIVPRVKPRLEQWVRADRFRELGLADMLHPRQLSAAALSRWMHEPVKLPHRKSQIDLDGLGRVRERARSLAAGEPSQPRTLRGAS